MSNRNWMVRFCKGVVILVPGAAVLGTSCAGDIRESMVAAGLDFVEGTTLLILENVFPVEEAIANP